MTEHQEDPFVRFKQAQRQAWASFSPLATFTTPCAASLVAFAGVNASHKVLDVACGTGVVAVTAARLGANVCGLDLSPVLLEDAVKHAKVLDLDIDFSEGDAEQLPYPDAHFDVVLSQFGHMFAPRPPMAVSEMLRVLKPGGRIAFSTWPPELMIGLMFSLTAEYLPAPEGAAPPPAWGDPNIVRQRLGDSVTDLEFQYGEMTIPALSPQHYRNGMENGAGPVLKVAQALQDKPEELARFRQRLDAIVGRFFSGNLIRQTFLMSRAVRRA
tara:strand:- start:3904 stop:4713 length:810 start_codon:yes stop_codon:yes gene_type:complete